ncbi:MAG: hypothetical protein AAFV53_21805 [Myxococcota bacterium]
MEHLCYDRHYLLANHISTDFFVIQDQWDPNPGHCRSSLAEHLPRYRDPTTPLTYDCGTYGDPSVANDFGDQIDDQAMQIAALYGNSQIGLGLDPSDTPTRFFVSTECNAHVLLLSSTSLDVTLEHTTAPDRTVGGLLEMWSTTMMGSGTWAQINPRNGYETDPSTCF